jgi:hypothetical protein
MLIASARNMEHEAAVKSNAWERFFYIYHVLYGFSAPSGDEEDFDTSPMTGFLVRECCGVGGCREWLCWSWCELRSYHFSLSLSFSPSLSSLHLSFQNYGGQVKPEFSDATIKQYRLTALHLRTTPKTMGLLESAHQSGELDSKKITPSHLRSAKFREFDDESAYALVRKLLEGEGKINSNGTSRSMQRTHTTPLTLSPLLQWPLS